MNLQNDGMGHWTLSWGKKKFFCIKCDLWYPLKYWKACLEEKK